MTGAAAPGGPVFDPGERSCLMVRGQADTALCGGGDHLYLVWHPDDIDCPDCLFLIEADNNQAKENDG